MDEDLYPTHISSNYLFYSSDFDSACSTPFVSAPSSPTRTGHGFFYSAPASPMHSIVVKKPANDKTCVSNSFEFEFSSRFPAAGDDDSVSAADELFLNGQIRPMNLKTHLKRASPLMILEESGVDDGADGTRGRVSDTERGREGKCRDKRRTRSVSPSRNPWRRIEEKCETEETEKETVASMSASSSRSSSGGRSSKRWIFLKEFLYRSKSEGRNNTTNNNNSDGNVSTRNKIWNHLSFSPNKVKKGVDPAAVPVASLSSRGKKKAVPMNGVGKRRVPASAHEMHYKANRAQSEEMRKKTFLPYRQGLIGCLGFSSKSYGAVNGIARSLNPVSSRLSLFLVKE